MQSSQALLHTTAFPLVEISFQCIHILCESILTTLLPLYIDCFLKVTYSSWENSLCEYLQYFVNTVYYSRAGRAFHFGLLCAELLLFFAWTKRLPDKQNGYPKEPTWISNRKIQQHFQRNSQFCCWPFVYVPVTYILHDYMTNKMWQSCSANINTDRL